MSLRRTLAAGAIALLAISGCDELTNLGGEDTELLGVSCEDGNDTTLVGLWNAESYDWGEGDMVAQGWSLEIELWDDGDGRLAETRPTEGDVPPDSTDTAPDPTWAGSAGIAATTHVVTDSAHFKWVACDGQLAVVFEQTYYGSDDGEFTDTRFDYSFDGTALSLSDSEGGLSITLLNGGDPTGSTTLDDRLFGTWTAVSIVASEQSGQFDPVELTSEGWALEVVLNDDGTYSSTSVEAGAEPVTDTGQYTTHETTHEGGILTLDNGPNLYYEISGSQVIVTDSEGEASYDFDDDGTEEPAVFVYTLDPSG